MDADYELQRLRDWRHDVSGVIDWSERVTVLNSKQLEEHKRLIDALTLRLNDMVTEDKITEAIRSTKAHLELTWIQRLGAIVLFVLTVSDIGLRLFHHA